MGRSVPSHHAMRLLTLPWRALEGRAIACEMRVAASLSYPPLEGQGYRMLRSISTRKLSSQAARLSLPRREVFVSG